MWYIDLHRLKDRDKNQLQLSYKPLAVRSRVIHCYTHGADWCIFKLDYPSQFYANQRFMIVGLLWSFLRCNRVWLLLHAQHRQQLQVDVSCAVLQSLTTHSSFLLFVLFTLLPVYTVNVFNMDQNNTRYLCAVVCCQNRSCDLDEDLHVRQLLYINAVYSVPFYNPSTSLQNNVE